MSGLEGDRQQASYSKSDNEVSLQNVQYLDAHAGLWETFYEDAE